MPVGALDLPSAIVPMAGRWDPSAGGFRFLPRLPFAHGTAYALVRPVVDGDGASRWIEVARLQRPASWHAPSAVVEVIHPEVAEVPENLLRLSVTFSATMGEGGAARGVHLEDPAGHEILHALFPMPPELWDRPRRRLTLLIEPGRIKRGLVPNTELGAPLAGLSAFDLVVDAGIRDAAGATLASGGRRTYRVGPPVRTRVDPARWRVSWPVPRSEDPLVVLFERPLDHALALRCVGVTDGDDREVPGTTALDPGGIRWTFRPEAPWPVRGARLHVDTALEDLAGNSVRRVFDRDLRLAGDDPVDATEAVLMPD